ncbi:PREDICTED: RIMS-binding protein 2, partial [Myotis davidii]|uniref:RIMS-binding protein 2 n=1 Tax=Myotis davidii TaxID=225400 RepID=UPI000767D537
GGSRSQRGAGAAADGPCVSPSLHLCPPSPCPWPGQDGPFGSRAVIGDYIQPLPLPGDSPEPLSTKPPFLSRSGSSRCRFESDMDNERNANPPKQRYSGKVHLCVARYSYNPFDGPNENPEAELPLTAGKYLYVYGDMDEDGFYEGELLGGQRGLVPSNFVDLVQDSEARLSALETEQGQNLLNQTGLGLGLGLGLGGEDPLDLLPPSPPLVPYPRKITLIKQLAKSVIVGWEPPAVPPGWGPVGGYTVLVDQQPRLSLPLAGRTKALIEKLSVAACTHRVSVQCVTSRGSSDHLRCTLLVGKEVVVAPSQLRVDNVTPTSARLSWLPTNSNYSHVVFLDGQEQGVARAARYQYQLLNLRPGTAYKARVLARPHQVPWQLPLEQREKKEAFVEFSTLPDGPPAAPQDVTVQAGATPAIAQGSWKPPTLSATGLSNGATVTGYGVYAKGQRVSHGGGTPGPWVPAPGRGDGRVSFLPHLLPAFITHPPPQGHPTATPRPPQGCRSPDVRRRGPSVDDFLKGSELGKPTLHTGALHTEALHTGALHTGALHTGALHTGALHTGALHTGALHTGALHTGALHTGALHTGALHTGALHTGALHTGALHTGALHTGALHTGALHTGALHTGALHTGALHTGALHTGALHTGALHTGALHTGALHTGALHTGALHTGALHTGASATSELLVAPGEPFPSPSILLPEPTECSRHRTSDGAFPEPPEGPPQAPHSARLFSIPEVAEEDADPYFRKPGVCWTGTGGFRTGPGQRPQPSCNSEPANHKASLLPAGPQVYGDKDADGFYRGETCARSGLIPCNMVSEIQAEDEEMMEQLLRQGFLARRPVPVLPQQRSRRGGRQQAVSTRRMVALYDYDPRESSPNIDVEAELTFCTGDIISVLRDIDEDGFYYGELNGQKGLVPSNFLEEVPDDVEVYLSDAPSHRPQDTPARSKANGCLLRGQARPGERHPPQPVSTRGLLRRLWVQVVPGEAGACPRGRKRGCFSKARGCCRSWAPSSDPGPPPTRFHSQPGLPWPALALTPHTQQGPLCPPRPPRAPGGTAPASWASGSVAAPGLTGGPAARPPDGLCALVPAPHAHPPFTLVRAPSASMFCLTLHNGLYRPINSLCSCVCASCSPHTGRLAATPRPHHTTRVLTHTSAGPAPSVSLGGSVPLVPDRQQHTRGHGHAQATARTGHGPAPRQCST